MIDQTDEKLPKLSDSFYDDNDHDHNVMSSPSLGSKSKFVASKPSVYCQQTHNSLVSSSSSDASDHDITDVSSINEQQRRNPFNLESMKTVLLGLSSPSSTLPSPMCSDRQATIKSDMNDYGHQKSHNQNCARDFKRIRLTSSAINRQQQQQRIERENLKILQRLQNVRPTRSLKRDELLSNYDRLMGVNISPVESHSRLSRPPSNMANTSSIVSISEKSYHSLTRSSSSLTSTNSIRSRPVSASNPSSSGRKSIWNDRMQQNE